MSVQPGYAGKFLRINLTNQEATEQRYDEATLRKHIGGAGGITIWPFEDIFVVAHAAIIIS